MKDDDKAPQEDIRLDRLRTALAIEAWNREARHRARVDAYDRITGREFTGTKQDPNAAFIIAVMQKQFLLLSGKPGVTVYAVPCFREESPDAAGIFTCVVEKLDWYGTEAIRRLREICDEVTESEEIDDENMKYVGVTTDGKLVVCYGEENLVKKDAEVSFGYIFERAQ